jgi:hypothetical protein
MKDALVTAGEWRYLAGQIHKPPFTEEAIASIEHERDPKTGQITTTDIHLVQAIGKSLLHAYGGVLRYGFAEGQYQLRVDWAA